MLYLVEREEDEMSDKHKISIFEDSKCDDATMDNLKSLTHYQSMEICIDDEDMEEDDDDSSSDKEAEGLVIKGERESMVLMGEERRFSREDSNPMMMSQVDDDEEKLKMMSDLESCLDLEEEE
jgi:hypothetical protein